MQAQSGGAHLPQYSSFMPRILPISHVSYELWLGLWLDYTAGEIPVESELHALTSRRLC
jgi:hypothetical protein